MRESLVLTGDILGDYKPLSALTLALKQSQKKNTGRKKKRITDDQTYKAVVVPHSLPWYIPATLNRYNHCLSTNPNPPSLIVSYPFFRLFRVPLLPLVCFSLSF